MKTKPGRTSVAPTSAAECLYFSPAAAEPPEVQRAAGISGASPGCGQFAVEEHTVAIHALAGEKRVVESPVALIKIGQALLVVHQLLGPGPFQEWLSDEFDWGQPAASRWMSAARVFGPLVDDPCLNMFRHSALYELARDRTPAAAREEAILAARDGREITLAVAKVMILRHLGISLAISQVSRACQSVRAALNTIMPGIETLSELERSRLRADLEGLDQAFSPLIAYLESRGECADDELCSVEIAVARNPNAEHRRIQSAGCFSSWIFT